MFRTANRPIFAATLVLLSLGLQAQAQAPAPTAVPSAQAPSALSSRSNHKGTGIDALLGAAKTSGDDFLPPDQAFRFDALAEGTDRVRLNWEIAEGYYLYRARIKVMTASHSAQLGAPQFPPGQVKTDEYFGNSGVVTRLFAMSTPGLPGSNSGRPCSVSLPVSVLVATPPPY